MQKKLKENKHMSRIIFTGIIGIVFFLCVYVDIYAGGETFDNLRPRGAAERNVSGDIADDVTDKVIDGGAAAVEEIAAVFFTDNTVELPAGAHTGLRNIRSAAYDGTDGELFNHSEKRGRLEEAIKDKIGNLVYLPGASLDEIKKLWAKDMKTRGLSEEDIKPTLQWLEEFHLTYIVNGPGMSNAIRASDQKDLAYLHSRIFTAQEKLARRVVNKIINAELKNLIEYEKNGFVPAGEGKFKKYVSKTNVLCVGETSEQYRAGMTNDVLAQDLTEILDGISLQDIERIRLRVAYEPRWMIGLPKDQIPGIDMLKPMIEANHSFIKKTVQDLYGFEIAVDYGGSLNKDNMEILRLKPVNGGLIGGAGKSIKNILPVITEAIFIAEEEGKFITLGLNWKAETGETGMGTLDEFANMLKALDLTKVQITLHSNQVKTVKESLVGVSSARGVVLPANYIDMAKELDVTQAQLADYLRASQDAYYRLAAGQSFELDFLRKIARLMQKGVLTSDRMRVFAFSTAVAAMPEFGELMRVLSDMQRVTIDGKDIYAFQIAVYGKNAGNIKGLGPGVIFAEDKAKLLSILEALGVESADIGIVRASADTDVIGVKQVIAGENLLLATGKAIQSVVLEGDVPDEVKTEVNQALGKYYTKLMEADIISKEMYAANEKVVAAAVDMSAAFSDLPAIQMKEAKKQELAVHTAQTTNFMTERGV